MEGAIKAEKDLQFDRSLYDELRARRDFGFEQVLACAATISNLNYTFCRACDVLCFFAQNTVVLSLL